MDELVIGEKKYISSKRAADLTGYAKDYIGQLCREGRVEARLVGRSWYVLEKSVLEHRFGKGEKEEITTETPMIEEKAQEIPEEPATPWNSPTYTAEAIAPLPELKVERPPLRSNINLLIRDEKPSISLEKSEEIELKREPVEPEIPPVELKENLEGEVIIPLHKVPEIPIPVPEPIQRVVREEPVRHIPVTTRVESTRVADKRPNFIGSAIVVAVAIIAVTIIAIGSGALENNSLLSGKNSIFINFLGGKSFYNK